MTGCQCGCLVVLIAEQSSTACSSEQGSRGERCCERGLVHPIRMLQVRLSRARGAAREVGGEPGGAWFPSADMSLGRGLLTWSQTWHVKRKAPNPDLAGLRKRLLPAHCRHLAKRAQSEQHLRHPLQLQALKQ